MAAALRAHGLGEQALWLDEANTWVIAREPIQGIVERLRQDASPPLYYIFLHGWMELFGSSAWVLRLPSLIAGVALVALTYRVGRLHFGTRAALTAAWLIAVSPSQISYSREVRMYSWLALIALYSTHRLCVALDRTGEPGQAARLLERRAWGLYALTLAATLLTHNFAFHLVPAHALIVAASRRPGRGTAAFAAAGLLAGLLYAPWAPVFLTQLGGVDTYSWYAAVWAETGPWKALLRSFDSMGPFGQYFPGAKVPPMRWLQAIGLGVLLVATAGVRAEGRADRHVARFPLSFAFAAPIVTSIALSQWIAPHFVPGRVDQMLLAPLMLLCGAGVAAVCPRGRGGSSILTACALLTLAAGQMLGPGLGAGASGKNGLEAASPGNEASVMEALAGRAHPGDVLICTSLSRAPLEHLAHGRGLTLQFASFPASTAEHLGGQDDQLLLEDHGALARAAETAISGAIAALEALAASKEGASALHIVSMQGPVNEVFDGRLSAAIHAGELVETAPALGFVQRGVHQFGVLRSFTLRRPVK